MTFPNPTGLQRSSGCCRYPRHGGWHSCQCRWPSPMEKRIFWGRTASTWQGIVQPLRCVRPVLWCQSWRGVPRRLSYRWARTGDPQIAVRIRAWGWAVLTIDSEKNPLRFDGNLRVVQIQRRMVILRNGKIFHYWFSSFYFHWFFFLCSRACLKMLSVRCASQFVENLSQI